MILSPAHNEIEAINPTKTLEEQVEEAIRQKGSFDSLCWILAILYSDLLHDFQDLSEQEMSAILQNLLSQSRIFCYFTQFECYFVHHDEMFGWSVSLEDQIIQPSSFLCIQKDSLSNSMRIAMRKKILYSIISNPGISLVGIEGEE